MKITYDAQEDVLRILLTDEPIETVLRDDSGITLDYDQHGFLVGLELHDAARHMSCPDGPTSQLDRGNVPLHRVPAVLSTAGKTVQRSAGPIQPGRLALSGQDT